MKLREQDAARLSALLSAAVSLLAALAFLLATTLAGDYGWVARLGGSAWIFLLAMIILLPTVMPWVRDRARQHTANGPPAPELHDVAP
jgi:hypothetical protein